MIRCPWWLLAGLVCVGAWAGESTAETPRPTGRKKPPIEVKSFQPLVPGGRSRAPVSVELHLINHTKHIIEGTLHYRLSRGGRQHAQIVSRDLVIAPGSYRTREFIPMTTEIGREAGISLWLEAKDKRYDLGSHLISTRSRGRKMVIGFCLPPGRTLQPYRELIKQTAVESYDQRIQAELDTPYLTQPAVLFPASVPDAPLALCSFNILALHLDALALLETKQQQAIVDWTRAGGSLLIFGAANLGEDHQVLIDGVEVALPVGSPLRDDQRYRSALGRIVTRRTVAGEPDASLRQDLAWLWRFRYQHRQAIAQGGRWLPQEAKALEQTGSESRRWGYTNDRDLYYNNSPDYGNRDVATAEYVALPTGSTIIQALNPNSVRLMPVALLVLILLVFVLLIGPGDYLVLKLLRARRYTWITFPTASILVTLFTVWLANQYMGAADHEAEVIVVDVDAGVPVRVNRFRQYRLNSNHAVVQEVEGGLLEPVSMDQFGGDFGAQRMGVDEGLGAAVVTGRPLTRQQIRYNLRKWAPTMFRELQLAPTGLTLPIAIDWAGLRAVTAEGKDPNQVELGGDATVCIYRNYQLKSGGIKGGWLRRMDNRSDNLCELDRLNDDVLLSLSVAPSDGIYRLFSSIAPQGSGDYEDLAISDPADPSQSVISVVVYADNRLWIIRSLYWDRAVGAPAASGGN